MRRHALAFAVAAAYLYCFPYFEPMRHANELPRIYLTMAIVDHGTLAIDAGVDRWGSTADVSRWDGHHYSNKAPGQSFLAVPAYLAVKAIARAAGGEPTLAELTWAFRVFASVLPSLLFLILLWRFLARYAPDEATRRIVLVGYALGTMALPYSLQLMSHHLAAIAIASAFFVSVWVVEDGIDERWMLAAGAAAGAAPLIDYQAAFAGVPIAIYVVWKLCARAPRRWRPLVWAIIGAIPPIAGLLLYHWAAFDSPFRTGYDASQTFAHFHQQGFLGIDRFRFEALAGSTVAADNGLVFLCPMLLLAVPGWWLLARRGRHADVAVTAAVCAIYLLFVSSINFWRGGWSIGPRYVTALLPFAIIPVAAAITAAERHWVARGVALALVVVSIAIYAVGSPVFPHWPEQFANPYFDLVWRLLGDGHAPPSAGTAIGLSGVVSLAPYLALIAGLIVWITLPSRREWRSAALALGLAAVILAVYAAIPGGGPRAGAAYQRVASWFPEN